MRPVPRRREGAGVRRMPQTARVVRSRGAGAARTLYGTVTCSSPSGIGSDSCERRARFGGCERGRSGGDGGGGGGEAAFNDHERRPVQCNRLVGGQGGQAARGLSNGRAKLLQLLLIRPGRPVRLVRGESRGVST
jgi:hypothetical protein